MLPTVYLSDHNNHEYPLCHIILIFIRRILLSGDTSFGVYNVHLRFFNCNKLESINNSQIRTLRRNYFIVKANYKILTAILGFLK